MTIERCAPLAISPRNCEFAIGLKWRLVVELAERHGVPILAIGRKRVIRAAPLLDALELEAAAAVAAAAPVTDDDEQAGMRRSLGLRIVGSSR